MCSAPGASAISAVSVMRVLRVASPRRSRQVGHTPGDKLGYLSENYTLLPQSGRYSIRMNIPKASEQLRHFRRQQAVMLDTIEQLVTLESPSDVKAAVDRLSTVLASRFGELGGKVKTHLAKK